MTRYRKALHYLPAILWLGIIFFLSGQTGEQTAPPTKVCCGASTFKTRPWRRQSWCA